jgi:hypothetical protein
VSAPRARPPRSVWARGLIGATAATGLNVGVFLVAVANHLRFRLVRTADVFITAQAFTLGYRRIHVVNVVIATVVPFLLGTALFGWAARRRRAGAAGVVVIGAVFAIASAAVPFSLARGPTSSIFVLASMHVLTGAIFVAAMLPALPAGPGEREGPRRTYPRIRPGLIGPPRRADLRDVL